MDKTKELRAFISDDDILECLILFENRKMDAAKLLASYVYPKWQITTLEAVKILIEVQK